MVYTDANTIKSKTIHNKLIKMISLSCLFPYSHCRELGRVNAGKPAMRKPLPQYCICGCSSNGETPTKPIHVRKQKTIPLLSVKMGMSRWAGSCFFIGRRKRVGNCFSSLGGGKKGKWLPRVPGVFGPP